MKDHRRDGSGKLENVVGFAAMQLLKTFQTDKTETRWNISQ